MQSINAMGFVVARISWRRRRETRGEEVRFVLAVGIRVTGGGGAVNRSFRLPKESSERRLAVHKQVESPNKTASFIAALDDDDDSMSTS